MPAPLRIFYLTWRWLVPGTLGRARVLQYVLGAALLVLPYAAVVGWSRPKPPKKACRFPLTASRGPMPGQRNGRMETTIVEAAKKPSLTPTFWMRVFSSCIVGTFIVGSASALRITGDYIRGQRNRRELERQQLLTELAMLKTQINPHFLFNTLNNIYSLTSRKSDKAPEAVLRLAEIMRYLLYESSTDTVPLSRELAHLRSFLDLQRLRLAASAQQAIMLEVEGTDPDCAHPIAPLLLLPLVENAFKHGDLTARPVAVHISAPPVRRRAAALLSAQLRGPRRCRAGAAPAARRRGPREPAPPPGAALPQPLCPRRTNHPRAAPRHAGAAAVR